MALTITKFKMWKDPGYTRNCPEIPPVGSKKLPAPDYTSLTNLRPKKSTTLTELELPLSFIQVFDMSYLYMEASDSGNRTIKVFGWIDSIEQTASSNEAVLIRWTVDWWRSYSGSATFGSGMITKSPDGSYKRPYPKQPRQWVIEGFERVRYIQALEQQTVWVYVPVVWTEMKTDSQGNQYGVISTFRMVFAPVTTNRNFLRDAGDNTVYNGPTMDYLASGQLDEFMDAIKEHPTIIGIYLAPFPPTDFSFDNTNHRWYQNQSAGSGYAVERHYGFDMMVSNSNRQMTFLQTFNIGNYAVDDTHRVLICDSEGNTIGELPWGMSGSGFDCTLDIGAGGGYMNLRVHMPNTYPKENLSTDVKMRIFHSVGDCFSIPLPRIAVNSNQWSEYMVTGQKDYDVTTARISNEQKAIAGLEGAASSAIGGGVTGAVGGPIGAAAGVVSGGALSLAMTGVNYYLGEQYNEQLQSAKERLYANQKNGVILPGYSVGKIMELGAYSPMIIKLEADSVSATEYTDDISLNGYDTDIPVADLSTILSTATGPYRIVNLNIRGNIPPQAKQYIKDKLERGVRFIENNPSGVAP